MVDALSRVDVLGNSGLCCVAKVKVRTSGLVAAQPHSKRLRTSSSPEVYFEHYSYERTVDLTIVPFEGNLWKILEMETLFRCEKFLV